MTRGPGEVVASPGALVRLDGVTCAYGRGDAAVVGASLAVGPHDLVGIVGPSGSGKTTLLRAMLGRVTPRDGTVTWAPGARVGYVPQLQSVDWTFPVTVLDVVLMALPRARGRWAPWADAGERAAARDVLERLGLGGLAGRHIRDLSGGQQQRVFIARALLLGPALLVLDEPTSGVDVRTRQELVHLLGELHADGLAVLLATHDLNGVAAHLPRVVCLNRRVVAEGRPLDVLTPGVLAATFGAAFEVLVHGGVPVVVDGPGGPSPGPGRGRGADRAGREPRAAGPVAVAGH
jgi:ABC-type Mn2+/Zn2+ transport system ATPase subunit